MTQPTRPVRGELTGVFLHVPFAFFEGCIVAVTLVLAVDALLSLVHSHIHDSNSIYNPILWVPSLFVGAIVNRFARHRLAFLAPTLLGVLIVIWFLSWKVFLIRRSTLLLDLANGHPWRYELWSLFSFVPPTSGVKGLEQLFVTFPLLNSVVCSIGAWLGLGLGNDLEDATLTPDIALKTDTSNA